MNQSKLQKLIEEKRNRSQSSTDRQLLDGILAKLKLYKGDPGKDAEDPSDERLIKLIKPLIPKVEDGHTPTDSELLRLIRPLIPKVKDGETPSDEKLLRLIKSVMPKPRDGKDAVMPNIYQLALDTIKVIESLKGDDRIDVKAIKGLEKFIEIIASRFYERGYGGPGKIFTDGTLSGDGTPGAPLSVVGTGADTLIDNEVVSGNNTSWVLAQTPVAGTVHLYANGQRLILTTDYTISGKNITTLQSWVAGTILADYRQA